jgi:hypothetical protein
VKGGDLKENNIKVDLGEIRYADVASVRKKWGIMAKAFDCGNEALSSMTWGNLLNS